MQIPSALHRADDVIAALHDHSRDVADLRHPIEELVGVVQEAAVDKVMALDACERIGEFGIVEFGDVAGVEAQEARGALPFRPATGGFAAHGGVVAGETTIVGRHHLAALGLREQPDELGIELRVQRAGTVRCAVEPIELPRAHQEDAAQHELGDPRRMGLRVGERQRRTPRTAEQLPALDAEVEAQCLHVLDEVPGGVVDQACMGAALAAAALVEQHDAVACRVEEPSLARIGAAARATVQEHHRLAGRVAALFPIDLVQIGDAQPAAAVGFDRWIQVAAHGRITSR